MVDISKLRKNDRLGEPPAITEVKNNLQLPENLTLDQRSLRKTGRVHQLATRVHPEFYYKVKSIAVRDRLKIVELLEKAIDCYENKRS